jgi:acyl-[acyl carrier protein]--UDP-N-acetylglucosamine O-acyltransferase
MRKHTKRKIWKLIDPVRHAILGAGITQDYLLDKLRLTELAALDAMTKGLGTVQDWQELTDMMNISEVMALSGVGPEVLPYCERAQNALEQAALRYQSTLRMGLSGEGIKALRDVYAFHDLQRRSISRSEYEKYIIKTKQRIMSKAKEVVEL